MSLVSIGVDHRTAPVEVREALAFDPDQARRFLVEDAASIPERLLLSTCNRTEILAVTELCAAESVQQLVGILERARGAPPVLLDGHVRSFRDEEAVRHLFRVACGLESMVLGETQILGQVKQAAELSEGCGATGPVLRQVLTTAVRVAKRARTETSIGEGAVSVASAAVELAQKVYGDLDGRSALVVGAGETGRLVAQHLRGAGVGSIRVANRTLGRAEAVAGEVDGQAWGLCGVPPALREVDIVVTSTAAEAPILTHAELRAAMRQRKDRMLLILDIAVPRDVEERAGRIEGVFLQDIDALRTIVDENLAVRRKAVTKVEGMVEGAVAGYVAWRREMGAVPTVKALREHFEGIRRAELDRNLKRVPPEARDAAERLTESLLNRLLHEPTLRIRNAARDGGAAENLIAAARRLFGIDGEETK